MNAYIKLSIFIMRNLMQTTLCEKIYCKLFFKHLFIRNFYVNVQIYNAMNELLKVEL